MQPFGCEAVAVEKLARERGKYNDGEGLWLTVRSPTSRSWLFIYMINRTPHQMGLGPYPKVPLAMARECAAGARRLVKAHRAPLVEREAVRAAELFHGAGKDTFRRPRKAARSSEGVKRTRRHQRIRCKALMSPEPDAAAHRVCVIVPRFFSKCGAIATDVVGRIA